MNKKDILLNEIVKEFENKEEKLSQIFTDINYIYSLLLKCCIKPYYYFLLNKNIYFLII